VSENQAAIDDKQIAFSVTEFQSWHRRAAFSGSVQSRILSSLTLELLCSIDVFTRYDMHLQTSSSFCFWNKSACLYLKQFLSGSVSSWDSTFASCLPESMIDIQCVSIGLRTFFLVMKNSITCLLYRSESLQNWLISSKDRTAARICVIHSKPVTRSVPKRSLPFFHM
jgi:hypothetical protein